MNSKKYKRRKHFDRNLKSQMPSILKKYVKHTRYEDLSKTFPNKSIKEVIKYFFYNYEFSKRSAAINNVPFTTALTKIRKTINYYGEDDFYSYIKIFHQLNNHLSSDKYFTELMKYITEISYCINETIFEKLDESKLVYDTEYIYPDLLLITKHPRLFSIINELLKYDCDFLTVRQKESIDHYAAQRILKQAYQLGFTPVNMLEISYLS